MGVYERIVTDNGGIVFKNSVVINHTTPELMNAIKYGAESIVACGHKNGSVHSEIIIDDKGPVLIEHN
ncbi:hypothetical protein FACS189459_1960 [Bacilli bacterium]|nr:hypothetical protein FACS189459_1960 [Bacilli bacterium]